MFYRTDIAGNAVLFHDSGEVVTCLPEEYCNIYSVDSSLSVCYEHPEGIIISIKDAKRIGIPAEDDWTD